MYLKNKGGRPRVVAVIDWSTDTKLQLVDNFHNVAKTFHYREVMALSRAIGVTPITVYNWKYGITFPGWEKALAIIDWVSRDKPVKIVPASRFPDDGMF